MSSQGSCSLSVETQQSRGCVLTVTALLCKMASLRGQCEEGRIDARAGETVQKAPRITGGRLQACMSRVGQNGSGELTASQALGCGQIHKRPNTLSILLEAVGRP